LQDRSSRGPPSTEGSNTLVNARLMHAAPS
jgi:hypothetical protein